MRSPVRWFSIEIVMSMFSTNTLPSHTATPRLATIPALLKTATLSGYHFQISLPVAASSA